MATLPECPECGADHEAAPDAFGVYSCSDCEVLFRPAARVPIRRAKNSEGTAPSNPMSWVVSGVIGIGAAVAIILGDSQAPPNPTSFDLQPIHLEIPAFDPSTLAPFGPVALAHEVHLSRVVENRLQATGLVRNLEPSELLSVALELRFIDVAGANVGTHAATISCRRIAAHGTCAWAVDAPVPAGMVSFELAAWAHPNAIGDVFEPLELHEEFDAVGHPLESGDELALDLRQRTIRVRVPEGTRVFEAWATLTCLDDEGRVLDVLATQWPESLVGDRVLPIPLPQHEPSRYELRVGGTKMLDDLALPILPP
jgi:hypothetical protein